MRQQHLRAAGVVINIIRTYAFGVIARECTHDRSNPVDNIAVNTRGIASSASTPPRNDTRFLRKRVSPNNYAYTT